MTRQTLLRATGILTIFHALLMFAPLMILGGAIDWPGSLDLPPAEALPLILSEAEAVQLGYGIYLGYSVLWVVTGSLIAFSVSAEKHPTNPLLIAAIAFICASAFARAIGIMRWLTSAPILADAHSRADPETSLAIETMQAAIDSWGGAIGEYLGVAFFTSLWLTVIALLVFRHKVLPTWIGWSAVIVAPILASPITELFGFQASIFVSTLVFHLWLLAFGTSLIFSSTKKFERKS